MDVTVSNFRAALALVRKFLPGASFVSFDLEFTGLGESRPSQLDTPQSRYTDARSDVDEFVPIQFGLAIFRRHENRWQVIPFNFNISPGAVYYPQSARYPFLDSKFSLQGSTVAFLADHGFDFDKCLRLGVSWQSKIREEELRKFVEADLRHRREKSFKEPNLGDDVKKLTTKLSEDISKFIKDAESHPEKPDKQIETIPLPRSGIERAVAFHHIRANYSRVVGSSKRTSDGMRLQLQLFKTEEEASANREEMLLNDVDEIVSRAAGFRYVIDLMVEARVPLVVHNGLLDVMKLYGTFVGPLPETLRDFKGAFRKAFPVVYDTRALVEQVASQDAAIHEAVFGKRMDLSELVSSVRDIVKSRGLTAEFQTFVPTARVSDVGRLSKAHPTSNDGFLIAEGESWDHGKDLYEFGRYMDSEFGHEAGFDAVQTGFLFGLMSLFLKDESQEGDKGLDFMEGKILLSNCGGYRWVDLASVEEDEVNKFFEKDVFVVSRHSPGADRLEGKSTLEKIFKGTKYEETKRDVIFAGPDAFIVVLNLENGGVSDDALVDLERNAEQTGVKIYRYNLETLSLASIVESKRKKRKFSD